MLVPTAQKPSKPSQLLRLSDFYFEPQLHVMGKKKKKSVGLYEPLENT
jgi:hypothetical protein